MKKSCKKELPDEIIAQISLDHHELLSVDPLGEFSVIHTENERRFQDKIINHKNVYVKNDWFVDVKNSKKKLYLCRLLKKGSHQHRGSSFILYKEFILCCKRRQDCIIHLRFCQSRKCMHEIKVHLTTFNL